MSLGLKRGTVQLEPHDKQLSLIHIQRIVFERASRFVVGVDSDIVDSLSLIHI